MRSSVLHNSTGVPSPIRRIRATEYVAILNDFMRQPAYIIVLAAMTVVFNLLSADISTYTAFLVIGIYIALFSDDILPLMPIVIFSYIAPSPRNNPGSGRNQGSIFYPENGGYVLYTLFAIFVLCLVFRLVRDPDIGGRRFVKAKRSLMSGMVYLGVAYLVSGFGMVEYFDVFWNNLLFAVIQFAAVFVMYFLFTGAVRWNGVRKDYFIWIGLAVGFVVLPQLLENYFSGRIFMHGTSTIDRELMYTGWGMHNNIGGLMAMMVPFPFYLASRREKGWIYTILATVLMAGVVLSCSRASMIVGGVAYCVCAVLLIRGGQNRKENLRVFQIAGIAVVVVCVVFFRKLMDVFDLFFEELFLVSQRDNLFEYGMKQFFQHPIFGGSFFPQGEYVPWTWITSEMGEFFPPRWHNSIVQVAASCGLVGLGAYGLHRYQTVRLFLKRPSAEKQCIAIYVGLLLVLSLFDCHFFNVGPTLLYSMALAFAEKMDESR